MYEAINKRLGYPLVCEYACLERDKTICVTFFPGIAM